MSILQYENMIQDRAFVLENWSSLFYVHGCGGSL